MFADGCFVFKWNKAVDINEPTKKAIIVHDAGREDLLLQVKYEGPLEEFGWLIPVPSLPKVEKGSMEPFYELSELTQRQFGAATAGTLGMAISSGAPEPVRVIEIKTVGAYEVAILSAQDAGSLARWLKAHDFSLPEDTSEIVDDYTRRGWYFIAAKIELNKGRAFKTVSATAPKDTNASAKARTKVQQQLSSGELHPLLISFDTPKCIFPLKISAVNGKPSEVSLYVLSQEPLLEKFTFAKACEKLEQSYGDWIERNDKRSDARTRSIHNLRAIQLARQMDARDSKAGLPRADRRVARDWTNEDLNVLAAEMGTPMPDEKLYEAFYGEPSELLQHMRVEPGQITKSSRVLARLKGRDWHLTKLVRTFTTAEMQDLEFETAVPMLAAAVSEDYGFVPAQRLVQLGDDAIPFLLASCRSRNPTERLNALRALQDHSKTLPSELLERLLRDESPRVRLHAARCAGSNWDARFTQPLIALLRDPHVEIRQQAIICLSDRESTERTSFYLGLLSDSEPQVRSSALAVAAGINRIAGSEEVFREALRLLRDPSEDVQSTSVSVLLRSRRPLPLPDLLPLLNHSNADTVAFVANLLRGGGRIRYVGEPMDSFPPGTAVDLAPLLTNRFGSVRLTGLRAMQDIADATAVELTLPLLRDTNSVIRSHALYTLRTITGKDIAEADPVKWEAWWTANKATFTPRQPRR